MWFCVYLHTGIRRELFLSLRNGVPRTDSAARRGTVSSWFFDGNIGIFLSMIASFTLSLSLSLATSSSHRRSACVCVSMVYLLRKVLR